MSISFLRQDVFVSMFRAYHGSMQSLLSAEGAVPLDSESEAMIRRWFHNWGQGAASAGLAASGQAHSG